MLDMARNSAGQSSLAANYAKMSTQQQDALQITHAGKEYLDRTIQALVPTFRDDPVYTWLLQDFARSEHERLLPKIFLAFFTQGALNGGIFIEVADFRCCGLLMPPGKSIENLWTIPAAGLFSSLWYLGFGAFKRAMFDYTSGPEAMMKQEFTKQEQKEHWYIFIMGTAVDHLRQGYAGRMLEHIQDRARGDGRPIWLEATTERSRALYLKHGFQSAGEAILGKGKVGPTGLPEKEGAGFPIWSMFWRP